METCEYFAMAKLLLAFRKFPIHPAAPVHGQTSTDPCGIPKHIQAIYSSSKRRHGLPPPELFQREFLEFSFAVHVDDTGYDHLSLAAV